MRTLILYLIFFASASITQANSLTAIQDSVGVEKIDGILYVIHEVEEKETLYALFRRYGTPVKEIVSANPGVENGLEIGQRIRIPLKAKISDTQNMSRGETHVVAQGETLFSISRRYDVNVSDLKAWNKLTSNDLEIGQKLLVGNDRQVTKSEGNTSTKQDSGGIDKNGYLTHVMAQGETLFSLSKSLDVTIDQLKEWNDLVDNSLSIGQELIVGKKVERQEVVQEITEKAKDESEVAEEDADPFKESRVTETEEVITQPVAAKEGGGNNSNNDSSTIKKIEKEKDIDTDFEEIVQNGQAELIEGSVNTRKYLALHRTAKIGTIMKVRNEMNGQEVFVRVLGKLPDTDINNNVLIKISKAAYNRLGAIDQKFRVSISYIP